MVGCDCWGLMRAQENRVLNLSVNQGEQDKGVEAISRGLKRHLANIIPCLIPLPIVSETYLD